MTHVLLKSSVAIPSKDKLHPTIRRLVPTLEVMAQAAEDRHGLSWGCLELNPGWNEAVDAMVDYGHGVYSFPFLNPNYVDDILLEVSAMSFEVNAEEDALVQIPEFTLQDRCPSLHTCMHSLFNHVLKPLAAILYGVDPAHMQSIQFAQYTPENTAHGHWHHDQDSDITLVVALSDHHKGGGTMVKPQGFDEPFEVPQLPVGHAMLFRGSQTLHYGMPVTEGARNLLVFWSTLRP